MDSSPHTPPLLQLTLLALSLSLFLPLLLPQLRAEEATVQDIHPDRLPPGQNYLPLMRHWRFQVGDDTAWASPAFPDSGWQELSPLEVNPEDVWEGGTAWWRLHIHIDSTLAHDHLAMIYMVYGAVEVYLDGKRLISEGKFGPDGTYEQGRIVYFPPPLELPAGLQGDHLLALRVNRGPDPTWMNLQDLPTGAGFVLGVGRAGALTVAYADMFKLSRPYLFLTGLLFATGAIALILFLQMRSFRAGLYFGLFGLISSIYTVFWLAIETDIRLTLLPWWHALSEGIFITSLTLIVLFLQASFRDRRPWLVRTLITLAAIGLTASLIARHDLSIFYYAPYALAIGWILIRAIVRKRDDAVIATIGFGILLLGLGYNMLLDMGLIPDLLNYNLVFGLTYPWPAIAMIALLARQFSRLSHELDQKEFEALELRASHEHARLATVQKLSKAVAHEFNSPLAVIQGFVEMLRQGGLTPEKTRDYLNRLPPQVERMKELVQKLMRLRTIEEVDYADGIKMLDLHGPKEDVGGEAGEEK